MSEDMTALVFSQWLSSRLTDLDIDPEVYSSYISSILEEDDSDDDVCEALNDILSSFVENPNGISKEIFTKWVSLNNTQDSNGNTENENCGATLKINDYVTVHVAKKSTEKSKTDEVSDDDRAAKLAAKKALLAKYSEVEEGYAEEGVVDKHTHTDFKKAASAPSVDSALNMFQNLNVSSVMDAEKKTREKQKDEAAKKKEKDKLDREKLKSKKDERKEKEKKRTQKKERGRMM